MKAENASGWCEPSELNELRAAAKAAKEPFVEIGSYLGRSTLALAEHGVVYAIDPHLDYDSWEKFRENTRDNPNVRPIRKKSADAIADVPTEIGLLFIDGDHSYDGVRADLLNYVYRLRPRGYLILHDYAGSGSQPTQDALDSFEMVFGRKITKLHVTGRTFVGVVE